MRELRKDHVIDLYTSGYSMVESFYAGSRFLGWEDIVIGDPLCAPYLPSDTHRKPKGDLE